MRLADFDIDLNRIKEDSENFHFEINDEFFGLKSQSLYNKGELTAHLKVSKLTNTATFEYIIDGKVGAICERCLTDIHLKIDIQEKDVYKLIHTDLLENEDYTISASNPTLNVYDSIYDLICLSLPIRKLCENSIEQFTNCEIILDQSNQKDDAVDERWNILNKLKK
jgi:uncharacterized protein